jgi:G:T/U-mismatch repair DNA glycosylase
MLQNTMIETYNAVSFSSAQAGQQYLGPREQPSSLTMYLVGCDDGLDSSVNEGATKATVDGLRITRWALLALRSRAPGRQCRQQATHGRPADLLVRCSVGRYR